MTLRPETIASLRLRIQEDPRLAPLLAAVVEASRRDARIDVEHVLRIAVWTVRFLPADGDRRAAIAAALLHETVEVARDEIERTRASERNAARAARLLTHVGFDGDAVRDICMALRDRSHESLGEPQSAVGASLQDADRLESLGTLTLLRTIATGGRVAARAALRDRWNDGRTLEDRALNVAHFFVQLLRLPALMRTPAGRAEAERRAAAVRRFLGDMADDLEGPTRAPGGDADE
jgi:uncharacterized protein